MTTIATDGRTMAADSLCTRADTVTGTAARKIIRLRDGRLLGWCGDAGNHPGVAAWLNGDAERPATMSGTALILHPGGRLETIEDNDLSFDVQAPYASGSGFKFALAAMDMGATPAHAVAVAAARDVYTGGDITIMAPGPA